jgi:hypothetical protein
MTLRMARIERFIGDLLIDLFVRGVPSVGVQDRISVTAGQDTTHGSEEELAASGPTCSDVVDLSLINVAGGRKVVLPRVGVPYCGSRPLMTRECPWMPSAGAG